MREWWRIAHTLRPQRGFVQRLSLIVALMIGTRASAATVVTFVTVSGGETLILSNPQTSRVSGRIRLIPDTATSASVVTFALPAQGSQTFPGILSSLGVSISPAILAVESSDILRASGIPLRLAYPERPLTVPVRFNPSTPSVGSLVLAILNGLVRINIYEHQTSATPLVSRTFGSSGEQVTRMRYIDLIRTNVAIADGYAEVIPLAVVGTAVNPPARRRAVGIPAISPPTLSIVGSRPASLRRAFGPAFSFTFSGATTYTLSSSLGHSIVPAAGSSTRRCTMALLVEGAMEKSAIAVTPAQAQWIVERMIADRRISAADVRNLLAGLGQEIAEIERRLSTLREAARPAPVGSPAPRSEAPAANPRKRTGRRKKGHPRGIAGTLAVLLRSIPTAEHAAIAAIRAHQGIKAAIKAATQAAAKKG